MSWFDVPSTQMSIFILFASAGVWFEGAFSLWVSLIPWSLDQEKKNDHCEWSLLLKKTIFLIIRVLGAATSRCYLKKTFPKNYY